jgi:hypothetical protein
MIVLTLPVSSDRDVLYLRGTIQKFCREVGFNFLDQIKMGASASQVGRAVLGFGSSQAMLSVWQDDAKHWWIDIRFEIPAAEAGADFETRLRPLLEPVRALMDNFSLRQSESLWQIRLVRLLPEFKRLLSEDHVDFLKRPFHRPG